MKIKSLVILLLVVVPFAGNAQMKLDTIPPMIKSYQNADGRISKTHYFNFINLKDESGENQRQATGKYWEVSYVYDSVFRQKDEFASFIRDEVERLDGVLFFQDTTQIHFAIPRPDQPNLWGKVLLRNDRVYRLQLIEETSFNNRVDLLNPREPEYDEFVHPLEMPEHLSFLPNTYITSARYSKFNHYRITFTENNRSYRQILKGPYWDLKLEVRNEQGETDKRISDVEIMESYYRAAVKAGGEIIKSKPRELIFYIPEGADKKLYVRVVTSLDGIYFLRAVLQSSQDATPAISAIDQKQTEK